MNAVQSKGQGQGGGEGVRDYLVTSNGKNSKQKTAKGVLGDIWTCDRPATQISPARSMEV